MKRIFFDAAFIGKRKNQQDYKANLILKKEGYMLFVLADGMGGHVGGEIASKEVSNGVLEYFQVHGVGADPEKSLRSALDAANKKLTDILREKSELNGLGTTLIVVLYKPKINSFTFLSVGDSPLYVHGSNGLKRINENHAYYESLLKEVKAGAISQDEADSHPNRHAITSCIMGKKIPLIDTKQGVLQKGELLLMASDGVQTLSDEEINIVLQSKGSIEDKVDNVINCVKSKKDPHQDNTTIILVESSDSDSLVEGFDETKKNSKLQKNQPENSDGQTEGVDKSEKNLEIQKSKSKKISGKPMFFVLLGVVAILLAIIVVLTLKVIDTSDPEPDMPTPTIDYFLDPTNPQENASERRW